MLSSLTPLLGAGWQQTDRLLKLETVLGPDILLAEQARIEEALGPDSAHAGLRIELSAISADAGLVLADLLGQPASLWLQTAHSRNLRRPFHGHITHISRSGADGGFARYHLCIEPWLAYLGHNRDSYLFQDKSVIEIVDEILADWQGKGRLEPLWRWDLADASRYPKRGMTTQYGESDLAFLKRLLAEEGIFCWFEHSDDTPGQHTLVLADHNGAFSPEAAESVRYTQAGATLEEDSLDRWFSGCLSVTGERNSASWDYRSLSNRPQHTHTVHEAPLSIWPPLPSQEAPGQYAWQTREQGERMTRNQHEAIDARARPFAAGGTLRTATAGRCFTLCEHYRHQHETPEERRFLSTRVLHLIRNNLEAELPGLPPLKGRFPGLTPLPVEFYRCEIDAIRASLPWRAMLKDETGRRIHPAPTVHGDQTAVVVGTPDPTHTDRDLRVRIQFPWQRGSKSGARQTHPSGADNAPANDSLGVWVRVLSPIGGANWGGHLTPRPGQEVIVTFLEGNIDRPVVIGATYNGRGRSDAQGNHLAGGTMEATANAPSFFAGEQAPPHTHGASLSGIKTQQLANSRDGRGGYNQLVFDDTPGQGRIELATTEYQSRLQLGHLREQNDNARLNHRGHGADLATTASAALRAGSGMLISADARPNASSTHLDSREPITQTEHALSLSQSLAELAAKQHAALNNDPAADKLPAIAALSHAIDVLSATDSRGPADPGSGDGPIKHTRGGDGTVPAWSEPRLHFAAPAGIAQLTPNNHFLFAGKNLSIAAGHDTNLIAQANQSVAVKDGIAFFTHGKRKQSNKPNQETGTHFHAASGTVSLQSQSGKTTAAADKKVTFASTHASLNASAPKHLLLTAKGAYIKLAGGNIELHAPGKVEFKASFKKWTGPKSASSSLALPKTGEIKLCGAKNQAAIAQGGATLPIGG